MPGNFLSEQWPGLVDAIATAHAFPKAEREAFAASPVAALIGAIPFLADCQQPARSALAHLGTYVLAARKPGKAIFLHEAGDDASTAGRLATIAGFQGGNRAIIERGMNVLCLVMLEGYHRDEAADKSAGKYNPLNAGAWDYAGKKKELIAAIAATPCTAMDAIIDPSKGSPDLWDW